MEIQHKTGKLGQNGFTLMELLVVLGIIGILVTITFIALEGLGKKSRLATASSSMKSATTVATTCLSIGGVVSDPGTDTRVPLSGGNPIPVCSGITQISSESVWPNLPSECLYCGKTGTTIYYQCSNDTSCGSVSDKSYCDYQSGRCVQNN